MGGVAGWDARGRLPCLPACHDRWIDGWVESRPFPDAISFPVRFWVSILLSNL